MRTITEGTWSGYMPAQSRVVHRTVHKGKSPFAQIDSVQFTDGTRLDLTHRPAKPREKVNEIHSYDKLLWELKYLGQTGYCSVRALDGNTSVQPKRSLLL